MPTVRLHTPVSALPVSLATLREHLRVDVDIHDATLARLCLAAAASITNETNRQIGRATLETCFDAFPDSPSKYLIVGRPPVVGVTTIEFQTEGGGASWSPEEYAARVFAGGAEIRAIESWPTCRSGRDVVVVRAEHGYDSANLPADLQHALLMLVGHWFEHPEAVVTGTIVAEFPLGVSALISPWRLPDLA